MGGGGGVRPIMFNGPHIEVPTEFAGTNMFNDSHISIAMLRNQQDFPYRWNLLGQICSMIRTFKLQCCGTNKTFLVLLIQLAIDLRMELPIGLASEASCSNSTNTLAPHTHWPLLACGVVWEVGGEEAGSAQLCSMVRILRYRWNLLAQICSMIRIFKLRCCETNKTFHTEGICWHKYVQ